ncbi:MAG TPA: hypothetical protein VFL87_01625 [Thermoleophilaceae bacterium]|nr:hypothetical protein [Thermoleophilaceae bacterium]
MKRSAAASFALAAVGMLYSRLGGRRQQPEPDEDLAGSGASVESSGTDLEGTAEDVDAFGEQPASSAEVDRARSELADELRRRASRPSADG